MKNNKKNRILSLLLAAVMIFALILTLASCGGENLADSPITAEAKLTNFINFSDPDIKILDPITDLTKDYGKLDDEKEGYAIFYKSDKDNMNILTETYTVYSAKSGEKIFSIANSYADEFGNTDKFGNDTYPEKLLLYCNFVNTVTFPLIAAEYVEYTPIDEEVIEKEELENSYSKKYYTEYYDVTGKLVSTSYTNKSPYAVSANEYYTSVALGKTVGVFDNKTYEMVESFNGDTTAPTRQYIAINDKYNYGLAITGMNIQGNPNFALEVFDKSGKLVCYYPYADEFTQGNPFFVLDGGDVLVQVVEGYMTAKTEYKTFLLDVETGNVTELEGFGYKINSIVDKDEFNEKMEKQFITATDNVRNILSVTDNEAKKNLTVFMDNFGNVNFTFEGRIVPDMDKDLLLGENDLRVLDGSHVLIKLAAGEANYAIMDYNGVIKNYLPKDAEIYSNCIVSGEGIFDFDMNRLTTVNSNSNWEESYVDRNADGGPDTNYYDNLKYHCTVGNLKVYSYSYTVYHTDAPEDYYSGVVLYDVSNGNTNGFADCVVLNNGLGQDYRYADGFILIGNPEKNYVKLIDTDGNGIITSDVQYVEWFDYLEGYNASLNFVILDDCVIFTFLTDEGYITARIDQTTYTEGDYDEK